MLLCLMRKEKLVNKKMGLCFFLMFSILMEKHLPLFLGDVDSMIWMTFILTDCFSFQRKEQWRKQSEKEQRNESKKMFSTEQTLKDV